jgi:hypothetical protein
VVGEESREEAREKKRGQTKAVGQEIAGKDDRVRVDCALEK